MFLLSSLLALTLCYAFSAVVAELLFTSEEERELPAASRTGFGFVVSVLYFSAAWQWMSIEQAWALALLLLAMYSVPALARKSAARAARVRLAMRRHLRGYLACVAGALVFFAPLIVGNNYGPFTEGGGDITIYADGTHYLTERNLTSRGLAAPSGPSDFFRRLRQAAASDLDESLRMDLADERLAASDRSLLNPPAAESAVYRLTLSQLMSPFPYPPYGEFFFLDNGTNYHVYFGIQAFLYGILLVSAFYAFRESKPAVKWLFLGLVVASHSLVSVFYNMYAVQAQALTICAMVLPALYTIRPFSKAGARIYGTATLYLWIGYVHFLSVVVPLFLVALRRGRGGPPAPVEARTADAAPLWSRIVRNAAVAIAGFLVALMAASAAQKALAFVFSLMRKRLTGDTNVFMGEHLVVFSWKWLAFLFGAVSQQHFYPFALTPIWLLYTIVAGVGLGILAFLLGLFVMLKARFAKHGRPDGASAGPPYRALYAVIFAVVVVHLYWAQTYIYTQAKGAQNVLIIFYAALMVPLAAALEDRERSRRWTLGLTAVLVGFGVTLLLVRVVYGEKMAFARDRAGILETSYFSEARRIRREDPNPFVLFEPRKSADLYLSIQPFSGARMVSTRHLSLLMIDADRGLRANSYKVDASDLIHPGDMPHLWWLAATAESRPHGRAVYSWKAERLADRATPAVLAFADDYEVDYGRRPRSADVRDQGMFSRVLDGSATVYLPAGDAADVEVKLAPREREKYEQMVEEVSKSLAKGLFEPAVAMEHDGAFVTLKTRLPARTRPEIVRVARFSGEYWVNVRVNGKDVASKALGEEKVSGRLVARPDGSAIVTATWSGVSAPDKEDWVGVFPVGGADGTRLAFAFTGGRKEGSLTLALPAGVPAGPYEVRLYRGGRWEVLATSPPIEPQAAKTR